MKQYVMAALLCTGVAHAARPAQPAQDGQALARTIEFNNLESAHENDWLSYLTDRTTHETKQQRNTYREWVDFHNDMLKQISSDKAYSEQFWATKLDAAIKLHEKQVAAHESTERKSRAAFDKINARHKVELNALKSRLARRAA